MQQDLPVGLALSIVPFLLGWGFAFFFHNVSGLKEDIERMTRENNALTEKVAEQSEEITDLRVKLTQADSEIYSQHEHIKDLRRKIDLLEVEIREMKEAKSKKD